MKTIRQIADELGVSRQAVYKKIKQEPLSTGLQQFTVNSDNTVYITVDGITLIKSAFSKDELSTEPVNGTVNLSTEFLKSLQEQNTFLTAQNRDLQAALEREREHSRQQAEKLTELTRNCQILLKHQQEQNRLLKPYCYPATKKERPFWRFWKK